MGVANVLPCGPQAVPSSTGWAPTWKGFFETRSIRISPNLSLGRQAGRSGRFTLICSRCRRKARVLRGLIRLHLVTPLDTGDTHGSNESQWRGRFGRRQARDPFALGHPRKTQPHRRQIRLRHCAVRCLHGAPERQPGALMLAAPVGSRRQRRDHRGRPDENAHRPGTASRLGQSPCAAMRLLPVGSAHDRGHADQRGEKEPQPHRNLGSHGRQHLPLWHLQPDCQRCLARPENPPRRQGMKTISTSIHRACHAAPSSSARAVWPWACRLDSRKPNWLWPRHPARAVWPPTTGSTSASMAW